MPDSPKPESIIIIGGGISGLASAWRLRQSSPATRVTILEAADRLGGVLQTERIQGYLVETAADMFTSQPAAALDLCRELGMEDQLLTTATPKHKAYVGRGSQVVPVPEGFSLMVPANAQAIRDWPLLSESGKQRLLDEVKVAQRAPADGDEDFQSFAIRRFGQEAFDVLIQPLVSGIYSADPKKLSMNATMKRFVDMEREHGSLIKAINERRSSSDAAASGARYNLFRTPQGGFSSLVDRLVASLLESDAVEIKTGAAVQSIERAADGKWLAKLAEGNVSADAIVVTVPAQPASAMLSSFASLSSELAGIESTSCAVVAMGIDRAQLPEEFQGFGIIYPHVDGGSTIAISFASNKFPGRADRGKLLLRFFIGGALQESLVDRDDQALVQLSLDQFEASMGCRPLPEFEKVFRWKKVMPQYHVGHLDRVDRIESLTAALPNFELAGKSYRGVGIPACIESAFAAADRLCRRGEA